MPALTPAIFLTTVDEVLDNVDPRTRNFLLKSSLLRSMNDALIVRVTGEENGQMQLEEIERQGLFLQRMDDSGEWFRYHPLFGNFLRQRCQWELAVELPEIHRAAAESWMAQGFPSEAIHHATAAGDAKMLRDILLSHAWGMFNHSELSLLEQSLAALPWSNLLENPRLILLQARLMQSQHRYSEVNTLLARAEQEMDTEMDTAMHGDFNALRARWRSTQAIRTKPSARRWWPLMNCRWPATTAVSLPHPYTVKFCTAKAS